MNIAYIFETLLLILNYRNDNMPTTNLEPYYMVLKTEMASFNPFVAGLINTKMTDKELSQIAKSLGLEFSRITNCLTS